MEIKKIIKKLRVFQMVISCVSQLLLLWNAIRVVLFENFNHVHYDIL